MKYFFLDQGRKENLGKVLKEWLGTPYRHWCGVKQGGVDCIHFVLRIFEEVGAIPKGEIKISWYPHDWHLHRSEELLMKGILDSGRLENVGLLNPIDGDLILYKVGRTHSHSGIYYGGEVYQARNDIGVMKAPWEEQSLRFKKKFGFRVIG